MKSMNIISEETFWQAVLDRDPNFDGKLFYGVHSTGIYCRPTCPSRRPNRSQVSFFTSSEAAATNGFRPCKRCHPEQTIAPTQEKILSACRYIEAQSDRIPTLIELGTQVAMSPTHLQRVFKQMIGVSPFEYGEAHRLQRLKQQLHQGEEIAIALYSAGYGSSSRLYEAAPEQLGMTPATYKKHGFGEEIRYATAHTPLGFLLIATTNCGLCSVQLGETAEALETELQAEFQKASLIKADDQLQDWIQTFVNYLSGRLPLPELPCDVRATAFQIQVWQALRKIPIGTTISYSDLASAIGQPTSIRAVASACARNPIALLVPCHRVVPKTGGLGGYRWGVDRKQALLDLEKQFLVD
jgi:AraC family transcriptional regulator, regulatory protein of adaptative response / methylated-DNA-[protein]-cysteine methyltransferase